MNGSLREQCVSNRFGFISNDNISKTFSWKFGIHLEDLGTNILAGNFLDFLSRFYPSLANTHDYTDEHLKGPYGNIGVLIFDNSLSQIVSDISNLGSVSSYWNLR